MQRQPALKPGRLASAAFAAAGALLLHGCALGPDFVRPEAPSVQQYTHGKEPAGTIAAEGRGAALLPRRQDRRGLVAIVQLAETRRGHQGCHRQQSEPAGSAGKPAPEPGQPSGWLRRLLSPGRCGLRRDAPAIFAAEGRTERRRKHFQSFHPECKRQLRHRRLRRRAPRPGEPRGTDRRSTLCGRRHLPGAVGKHRQYAYCARGLFGADRGDRAADRFAAGTSTNHGSAGVGGHRSLLGHAERAQPARGHRSVAPAAAAEARPGGTLARHACGESPGRMGAAAACACRACAACRPSAEPALRTRAPAPRHSRRRVVIAQRERQHRGRDRGLVPQLHPERQLRPE